MKQVYSFYVIISLCILILSRALHVRIMENIFFCKNHHFKPKIEIQIWKRSEAAILRCSTEQLVSRIQKFNNKTIVMVKP